MDLAEELERRARGEESPFRAQLLNEDAKRVRALARLAREEADFGAFLQQGRRLGWTQADARTGELDPALAPFLEAVYRHEKEGAQGMDEESVRETWLALWRLRMERLIGCLSTPPPPPD
ncbi:MAG TPA: hypothetical protein VF038_17985 [Usitatibacter sp.]